MTSTQGIRRPKGYEHSVDGDDRGQSVTSETQWKTEATSTLSGSWDRPTYSSLALPLEVDRGSMLNRYGISRAPFSQSCCGGKGLASGMMQSFS